MPKQPDRNPAGRPNAVPVVDGRTVFSAAPALMLVVAADAPRFTITNVNDAYLAATMTTRRGLIGLALFDAMPDNPDDPDATGVANLRASIERAISSGRPDRMPVQKYDIPLPAGGFEERWWEPVNAPVFDAEGKVAAIVHHVIDATERVRTDDALRRLNETLENQVAGRTAEMRLYRDIVQSDPSPILAFDRNYRVIGFNKAHLDDFLRVMGHEQRVGEVLPDLFPSDQAGMLKGLMDKALSGEAFSVVQDFGDLDRVRPTWEIAYTPLREESGGVIGAFHHARDISARLRAERELGAVSDQLAEQNAARERTWRFNPDLLSIIDIPDGSFERVNPAWSAVLGWSPGDIEGRPYAAFVHPDDLAASDAAFAQVRLGDPVLRFENRYRTRDGSWRWLSWVAFPQGNKLYSSTRDVTEARNQAEQLQAATKERERAWRLSQELLVTALPDGTIGSINPAWTRLLGWETHEIVGKPFVEFTHPDDLEATLVAFGGIFEKPLVVPYEYRFRHRDGTYRWFGWTGTFEDGQVYASGRDITLEKEQAEALRQSQKMEAVGQLTGGLAHDFNNLLAGISGSLEMMQNRMQQGRFADVERYMTVAQDASKRAAALTHRLLAFSRRQTLDPKPTDVNRLVVGMQEMIQRTVGPGIPVEVVGAAGVWPTLVDPPQLENALLNLCINARDAMPDGGRITVETGNKWLDERASRKLDMPEGQYLSLCVTDTGTGMTPDVVARVFEPFFTTKPIGQGTGLGLSMIYGFAKQSGGQVRIYSEVGQGTTVCLYLPRHYGEILDDDVAAKGPVLSRSEQSETVLVVDDEPTVRLLVTDILGDLGYASIEAGDSAAGLRILQSDVRIDLLVTDVGLPGGMNGRQMADAARVGRPELRVLFITGYAENAVLGNGTLAPGMAVLTKPFAMETMAARIRSMIEGRREEARQS